MKLEGKILESNNDLFEDVVIIEKGNKIDFKAFLKEENNTVAINNWNDKYEVFFKVNTAKNIVAIYKQSFNKYPLYNPFNKQEAAAIYNTKDDILYIDSYRFNDNTITLDDLNIIEMHDFKNILEESINKKIIELVDNNINNLNLSEDEIEEYNADMLKNNENYKTYKEDAAKLFIKGEDVNLNSYARFKFNSVTYSSYNNGFIDFYLEFKGFNIIKAIHSKDQFVDGQAKTIINTFKKEIYMNIVKNSKVSEFMEEMKLNEEYDTIKKVTTILNDKTRKTLNIHYKKNDKSMKFKIESCPHICNINNRFYINEWAILNQYDRTLFETTFNNEKGWGEDIYLLNIEAITYGKKVLYKK